MFPLNAELIPLPAPSLGQDFSFSYRLGGVKYHFRFFWNTRGQYWSWDFLAPDKTPIASGLRVVMKASTLLQHLDPKGPPGMLMFVDDANSGNEPGLYELGRRVKLVYVTRQL